MVKVHTHALKIVNPISLTTFNFLFFCHSRKAQKQSRIRLDSSSSPTREATLPLFLPVQTSLQIQYKVMYLKISGFALRYFPSQDIKWQLLQLLGKLLPTEKAKLLTQSWMCKAQVFRSEGFFCFSSINFQLCFSKLSEDCMSHLTM